MKSDSINNLTVTANGAYSFTNLLSTGASYVITVSTQPTGQICAVAGGSGTVASANISSIMVSCVSDKRIYVTTANHNGGFAGGLTGVDTFCSGDTNKPVGMVSVKAMVSSATRVACTSANCSVGGATENTNWIMTPNTKYIRPDATVIGITNASGIFTFPLTTGIGTSGSMVATALSGNWQNSGNNCAVWTVNTGNSIEFRFNTSTGMGLIYSGSTNCGNALNYYCVEQ